MSIKNYIWLAEALKKLPKRLPGALLVYGQKGAGKQLLARAIGQSLLCKQSDAAGYPCGSCDGCHLFEVGNHPDFRQLQPEKELEQNPAAATGKGAGTKKPSSVINVDAVRDLGSLIANAAHRGGARVILITPADALNPSAGNALLKMLEEPGRDTYFILVANERNRILPTIKSRCFQLAVRVPPEDVGRAWLTDHHAGRAQAALCLSSYAPFAALELINDEEFWANRGALVAQLADASAIPLDLATIAEKMEPVALGRLLSMWTFDLLALQQGADVRYNRDMLAELAQTAQRVSGADLCRWSDQVREYSRSAEHPLNRRLALESLFSRWPGTNQCVSEPAIW